MAPIHSGRNTKMLMVSCVPMLGAILFGVDSGSLPGFMAMESFLRDFGYYDEKRHAWAITSQTQFEITLLGDCGSILACILSAPIGDRLGRRGGLFITGLVSLLSVISQVTNHTRAGLLVGRLLAGAGNGFASNFVVLYLVETATLRVRGSIVSIFQYGITIGAVIGSGVNEASGNMESRWAYHIPLLVGLFFPLLLCILAYVIPETPLWLVCKRQDEMAASALRRLRPTTYTEQDAKDDIQRIKTGLDVEQVSLRKTRIIAAVQRPSRRRTGIACGLLAFAQMNGSLFINVYGTYYFRNVGIGNSFAVNCVVQSCLLLGLIVATSTMRYIGRRTHLIAGMAAQAACMIWFATQSSFASTIQQQRAIVASACLFNFAYGWSWLTVAWVVAGETTGTAMRSTIMSFATTTVWLCVVVNTLSLPYLINPGRSSYLGAKVGYIYASLCVLGLIWVFLVVPETRTMSLEEIDAAFDAHAPAKGFDMFESRIVPGLNGAGGGRMTAEDKLRPMEA